MNRNRGGGRSQLTVCRAAKDKHRKPACQPIFGVLSLSYDC